MSIEALIAPLMATRCFISYKTEWNHAKHKFDKFPIEPWTGKLIDAHDSTQWLTGAEILATRQPVAIVLSEQLSLFCVDLDNVRQQDGSWSNFAVDVCSRFAGAAFELSVSGNGIHILGCARIPEHRVTSDSMPHMQVYSRKRFIALTGNQFTGSLFSEHSSALLKLIADYLPEPIEADDATWSNGPYPGYRGGVSDDATLIDCMLHGRGGVRAAFGETAHFRDLWYCNVDVLRWAYPPESPDKPWNYSGADQALANHLAYATGCDCERVQRLMWYSGLRRDKWTEHKGYLRSTILRAVRGKIPAVAAQHVSGDAKLTTAATDAVVPLPPVAAYDHAQVPDDARPSPSISPSPAPAVYSKPAGTYMTVDDQLWLFRGCTYIRERHGILMPDMRLFSPSEFDAWFGGFEFQMNIDGKKPAKSAWECFSQSHLQKFDKAEGLLFDPKSQPLARVDRRGYTYINCYKAPVIERAKGDVGLFIDHVSRLAPDMDDRAILLAYMAFVAQRPGYKADWTPMLQGTEGNGKTILGRIMEYSVGEHYTYWPVATNIGNHFNAHLYGKILIVVDDLFSIDSSNSAQVWQTLMPWVTQDKLDMTSKGYDSSMRETCFNFLLISNNKRAIKITRNTRRLAPFFCPQQYESDLIQWGMDEAYFKRLGDWLFTAGGLAMVYNYLMEYQIPDQLNPCVGARRAPKTTSLEQAVRYGRGMIEQEVLEAIETNRSGFRGGFVSSHALDQLLAELGMSKKMSRESRRDIMEAIGYKLHSDLMAGRVSQPLSDGTMPYIYVPKIGHPSECGGYERGRVEAAFEAAQRVSPRGNG